ncbi:hypothetical protein BGZ54_007332 [Gamsiella multidivaricata]|nr:hypothetical protein BGZ54_007332 [Gamsiella multidivaricata]
MSHTPVRTVESRSNSPSNRHPSYTEDITAPGSPYLEFINQSFSTDNDLSLPERTVASPTLGNDNAITTSASARSPKERILKSIFKRESKDTLASDNTSSSIIPLHSSLAGAQQPHQEQQQPHQQQSSPVPGRRPLLVSDGSSSSTLTASVSTSALPRSILKQNRGPVPATAPAAHPVLNGTPPSAAQQQYQQQPLQPNAVHNNNHILSNGLVPSTAALAAINPIRPASPFAFGSSTTASSDGFDNTNTLDSTHRSSRNSSSGMDPNYAVTQTDLTLEGLAQRWYAYQALMKKSYAEDPFYKRWTKSKWILLLSTIMLLGYSCAVFAVAIGYMTHKFDLSVVVMEFHSNLIYLSLAGGLLGVISALIGLVGIFRENRLWLSIYALLLWPVFALYVSVGYIAFRRSKNHLRARIKDEWIHSYTREQRLVVQRQLKCCGYQDPNWYGAYDLRCFPLTNLPGCHHKYSVYEEKLLSTCTTAAFSLVPFQLLVMVAALLCSNHVDGMLRSGRPGLKSFKEEKEN